MISKNMLKIGHRGAAGYAPENTLASFRKALELKVDMIELDVYVCKSGELVVIHDDKVDRTTNGSGLVFEKTLEELKSLDAGGGEKIPALIEVLDLVDKKTKINIELKGEQTAAPTAEIIRGYIKKGWTDEYFLISSFNHKEVLKHKRISPNIKIAACLEKKLPSPLDFARQGFSALNPDFRIINRNFVRESQEAGLLILPWTVNLPRDIILLKDIGVDGIISDYPDRI